jgi:superoxide dismutase
MFTYYMIENMALSRRMTEKEQELRNVIEFYYMHKFFRKQLMSEEEKKQAAQLIANIQQLNATYAKFKQVEKLI